MDEGGRRTRRRPRQNEAVLKAARILMRHVPWLTPADLPMIRAFVQIERVANALYDRIANNGNAQLMVTNEGLIEKYNALRRTQLSYATRLGLEPRSRMEMQLGTREPDLPSILAKHANTNGEIAFTREPAGQEEFPAHE